MKRYIVSSEYVQPKEFTPEQRKARKAINRVNTELAMDMLSNLSDAKKIQLDKMLSRNAALTSSYSCSNVSMRVYKEGFYLKLSATRADFSVWFYDYDGELVEGRKPVESKLHFLYETSIPVNMMSEDDWAELVEG